MGTDLYVSESYDRTGCICKEDRTCDTCKEYYAKLKAGEEVEDERDLTRGYGWCPRKGCTCPEEPPRCPACYYFQNTESLRVARGIEFELAMKEYENKDLSYPWTWEISGNDLLNLQSKFTHPSDLNLWRDVFACMRKNDVCVQRDETYIIGLR